MLLLQSHRLVTAAGQSGPEKKVPYVFKLGYLTRKTLNKKLGFLSPSVDHIMID
jgi:hypothetical protein